MDGSHKQHRVKEAKTHMVHKLHDSIYIKWKYRQNSVRSQNNDSAENWGFCFLFWVLHGVECKPGEKLLICTITICSLFSLCSEKCYMKKNTKQISLKDYVCAQHRDRNIAGRASWERALSGDQHSGNWPRPPLGASPYVPGTGRKQAWMAEKGSWDAVTGRAQLPHGELCNWR